MNVGIFHNFFVLLKMTCLVTLFDRKLQAFKNSPKLVFLINFCSFKCKLKLFSMIYKH